MTDSGEQGMEQHRWRVLPAWGVLVAGAVAYWLVGHLPWIVEGMRLDVSPAWPDRETVEMPRVAMPFGEYQFQALLVQGVAGGTAALAVSRLAGSSVGRPRVLAAGGALAALVVALAQTLLTVRPALATAGHVSDEARLLVAALVVAALGSGALGLLVGAGVAGGRGWPWLLGGATAASLSGSWLVDLVSRGPQADPAWLLRAAMWHPWVSGVLLGIVLAVFGFRPASRVVGWLPALAIAWLVPSVLTTVSYVTHSASRAPLGRSAALELADAGRDVFVQSLLPSHHAIGPLALSLVIGVAGSSLVRRSERNPQSTQ